MVKSFCFRSELSDSDHGGIFSPDLTVKSAATPDFLLENLPETVIDWVEEVTPNLEQDLEPFQSVLQPGIVPTGNKNGFEKDGTEKDGSENNKVEKDGSVKDEVEKNEVEKNRVGKNEVEKNGVEKNGDKKVENCVETGEGKESPNLKVKTRERSRRVRLELAVDVLTLIGYHPLQVFLATRRTLELGKKNLSGFSSFDLLFELSVHPKSTFLFFTGYPDIYWIS